MISLLLERLFPPKSQNSREEVKRRLKLIVAHDRSELNSEILEMMRQEILEVVSRYVELDLSGSEFSVESHDRDTALVASLPILRVRKVPLPPPPVVEEEKINQTLNNEAENDPESPTITAEIIEQEGEIPTAIREDAEIVLAGETEKETNQEVENSHNQNDGNDESENLKDNKEIT